MTAARSLEELRDDVQLSLSRWMEDGGATIEEVRAACAALRDLDQVIAARASRGPAPPSFDPAEMHRVVWLAANEAGASTWIADATAIAVVKAIAHPEQQLAEITSVA